MTLHKRHGVHAPSELTRLQREIDRLRADNARLEVRNTRLAAALLNIQAQAQWGFPIDTEKLAKQCGFALADDPPAKATP